VEAVAFSQREREPFHLEHRVLASRFHRADQAVFRAAEVLRFQIQHLIHHLVAMERIPADRAVQRVVLVPAGTPIPTHPTRQLDLMHQLVPEWV
jgi:hypothetical protein